MEAGRVVYVNGIPDLKVSHIPINRQQLRQWHERTPINPDDPESKTKLDNLLEGSLIVVDEAHKLWPAISMKVIPEDIDYLSEHRHHGIDFYLITQDPTFLHPKVLKLVENHKHIVTEWSRPYIYQWSEYCSTPKAKTNKSAAIRKPYSLEKKAFGLYHSASLNIQKEKRFIPKMVYVCVAMLFIVPGIIYASYERINAKLEPQKPVQAAEMLYSTANPSSNNQTPINQVVTAQQTTVEKTNPFISVQLLPTDIDWTQVSACLSNKKSCICYGFSSERLNIPEASCRLASQYGWTVKKS